jgi:aminoglycoside phosphotransferase (APT) family kinase protein
MGADMANALNEGPAEISKPTATQAQSVRHVSALNFVPVPEPFGVLGTMDQPTPFHVNARVAGD